MDILLKLTSCFRPSLYTLLNSLIESRDVDKHARAVEVLAGVYAPCNVLNFGSLLSAATCSASPCWNIKVKWVFALIRDMTCINTNAKGGHRGDTTRHRWSQLVEAFWTCGSSLTGLGVLRPESSPFDEMLSSWIGRRSFELSPAGAQGIDVDLVFRVTVLMENVENCVSSGVMNGDSCLQEDCLAEFTRGIGSAIQWYTRHTSSESDSYSLNDREYTADDVTHCYYFNCKRDVSVTFGINKLNPAANLLLAVILLDRKMELTQTIKQLLLQRHTQILQRQQQIQLLHRQQQLLQPSQRIAKLELQNLQHRLVGEYVYLCNQQTAAISDCALTNVFFSKASCRATVRAPIKRAACNLLLECSSRMQYRRVRRRLCDSSFDQNDASVVAHEEDDDEHVPCSHLQMCVEIATQRGPDDEVLQSDAASNPTVAQLCNIASWGSDVLFTCFCSHGSLKTSDVCKIICSAVHHGNVPVVRVLIHKFRDSLVSSSLQQWQEVLQAMTSTLDQVNSETPQKHLVSSSPCIEQAYPGSLSP